MQGLLAVDIGSLFAVAFLLISFVGWIMNLINAQNPPPQPKRPAKRPQPRDRKVQSEIEDFLEQAIGRRGPKPQKAESDGIEILEPQEGQRRTPARRPPLAAESAASPRQPSKVAVPVSPGQDVSPRPGVGQSHLGTGLRTHLEQQMGPRVGQRVEHDLPHGVEKSIADHLGVFRADDRDTRRGAAPSTQSRAVIGDTTAFLAELRKPTGMRKAIVLQEILSKPRALRKG